MNKYLIAVLTVLFFFPPGILFAEQITVSVSDFKVVSDKAEYKYIGKGIARLVSGELAKSMEIKLIEREDLNKILAEQAFGLSDLADATKSVRIGRLITAQYLVFGEIIDMGNSILISARMVKVETGEIVWQQELNEKLQTYDYIAASLGSSILSRLGTKIEATTAAKVEKKEEKNETAIVKLSEGIDALDKGDKEKAKQELEMVRQLDPANEVAKHYLSLLAAGSAKFRVETDIYAATFNPASLGFVEKDQVYSVFSQALWPAVADQYGTIVIDGYDLKEYPITIRTGYFFPIAERLGLAFEFIGSNLDQLIGTPFPFDLNGTPVNEMHPDFFVIGGSIMAGFKVTDEFSVGVAGMVSYVGPGTGQNNYISTGLFWTIDGGFMFNLLENNLALDVHAAYSTLKTGVLDTAGAVAFQGEVPVIIDGSFRYAFFDKTLFLALKGIMDVYIDRLGGYQLRLVPIVEYHLFPFLALRAGYEFSLLDRASRSTIGHGFLGGLTIKIWKIEVSVNYTLRQIPSKMLPGYLLPGSTLSISASLSGIFFD